MANDVPAKASADRYSRESAAALRPLEFVRKPVVDETPPEDVRSVIVLVHGIRSHGTWMEEVKDALEFGTKVVPLRFGYLGPVRFVWATVLRRCGRQYRFIAGRLARVRSAYPNATVSVIAHSFGTFIVADLIRQRRIDRLEVVVFCGSIMPLDFPWTDSKERFRCMLETWWVNRFHDVGHLGFLTRSFARRYWRPIFRADEEIPDGNRCRPSPSLLQGALLRIKGLLACACALLLALYWLA